MGVPQPDFPRLSALGAQFTLQTATASSAGTRRPNQGLGLEGFRVFRVLGL